MTPESRAADAERDHLRRQLQANRESILASAEVPPADTFPRSACMRLLLQQSGHDDNPALKLASVLLQNRSSVPLQIGGKLLRLLLLSRINR